MKRDMDFCRTLLLYIEDAQDEKARSIIMPNYADEKIAYHCELLKQAGLIKNCKIDYAGNKVYRIVAGPITWEGAEYLSSIRDQSIWNDVKRRIEDKGFDAGFDVIKSIALELLKNKLEISI